MGVSREVKFYPLVEVLRLFSAFLIVWYHSSMSWGKELSYSGLVVFVILTAYFSTISNKTGFQIHKRFIRFLVPWLFWSAAYGLGNVLLGKNFFSYCDNLFEQIVVGNYFHLWYLPFIFFSLLVLDGLRGLGNYRLAGGLGYFFAVVYFLGADYWRPFSLGLPLPLPQYVHALGAILIGSYLGVCSREKYGKWWVAGLLLLFCAILTDMDISGVGIPYAVGTLLVIAALVVQIEMGGFNELKALSDCAYGIYLIHPMFLYVVGLLRFNSEFEPVLSFAFSLLAIFLIRKYVPKYSRYVT